MSEQAHFGLVRKIEVKVDETNDEIFALMVTLVWLYIEMLRLLSKLRSRR